MERKKVYGIYVTIEGAVSVHALSKLISSQSMHNKVQKKKKKH